MGRRFAIIASAMSLLFVVLVICGVQVYARPEREEPTRSDVIFVIGPIEQWRLDLASEYLDEGLSDALVISYGEYHKLPECEEPQVATVICHEPDPYTTRGETRYLAQLMEENGWTSAMVITTTPHVARTRLLMDSCVPGHVTVIGRSTGLGVGDWIYQFWYQTAAFIKLALDPGCL